MTALPRCTAEQVLDVVEAVAILEREALPTDLETSLLHAPESIAHALQVAGALGFLASDTKKGTYSTAQLFGYYFAAAGASRKVDLLRFALESFAPYQYFKARLIVHGNAQKASRETKSRFKYSNHDGEILETLLSLGQYCGSLTATGGKVEVSSADPDSFLSVFESSSNDEMGIKRLIREIVGDEAFEFIRDDSVGVIDHTVAVFVQIRESDDGTEGAVRLGNACENFLNRIADSEVPAISLTGTNGIIQKADRVKAGKAITKKHLGSFQFIGQMRNAADHGIDSDIGLEWAVSVTSVENALRVFLAVVRSCVAFKNGKAEF